MTSAIRDAVRGRADDRCEYCLLRQEHRQLTHHVEHVIAKKHGGSDDLSNLALACHRCNLRKGPNLTGVDPATGEVVPLFHPRRDSWPDHFRLVEARIEATTPTGRATVRVLAVNDDRRIDLRRELMVRGEYP